MSCLFLLSSIPSPSERPWEDSLPFSVCLDHISWESSFGGFLTLICWITFLVLMLPSSLFWPFRPTCFYYWTEVRPLYKEKPWFELNACSALWRVLVAFNADLIVECVSFRKRILKDVLLWCEQNSEIIISIIRKIQFYLYTASLEIWLMCRGMKTFLFL